MSDDTISRQAAIDATELLIKDLRKDTVDVMNFGHNYNHGVADAIATLKHLPSAERRGRWTIETIHQYELAYGTIAYEPVYKCSCCGLLTESYLRLDEPIMPDDADFPKWCGNCGAKMDEEDTNANETL